ncbi:MAG: hypothetical protein ACOC5T_09530 [Elusimicrobiota bacterium]
MGYELYCGEKDGTVNLLSTITMGFTAKNVTPKQLGLLMYNNIMKKLPELRKKRKEMPKTTLGTQFQESPIHYYIDTDTPFVKKPVITDADLKVYATKIKRIWEKAAKKKIDECRASGIKGEAVHKIEWPSGKNIIMPP